MAHSNGKQPEELVQTALPFSREERLEAISALTHDRLGVSRTMANRLRGLLHNLEFTTGRLGCFPSQSTLAAKMGVERHTIIRWLKQLDEMGLVRSEERTSPGRGKRSNEYIVDWLRIVALSRSEAAAEKCSNGPENLPTAPKNVPTRWHTMFQRDGTYCDSLETLERTRTSFSSSENLPAAPAANRQEWEELEREVYRAGVDLSEAAVAAAVSAGCSADLIRAIVRAFQARKLAPGVLYARLMRARPGDDPERGWPASEAPKPAEQLQAQQERERRRRRSSECFAIVQQLRKQGLHMESIELEVERLGYRLDEINSV